VTLVWVFVVNASVMSMFLFFFFRKIGKRKAALKADKSRVTLTKKAKLDKKDPNKPKRPPSPFFVFL
jgi:hypothetical protein